MNSREREFLRKKAHELEPIVRIGKDGYTDNVGQSILEAIASRELIKVKLLQTVETDKREIAEEIQEKTGCEVVGIIGKTIILYKENEENPKISLELKNR
ncbi:MULTISPECIES: ribosome assembly RNA-binding protein YhbY [Fusobacterium]|uniref:ribosome assembly RNA-binding protein YhbY n=1 Tax=Fusobacterium TaxID=848 RepID=UPI001477875B|nr:MULTISPECIES: ribosome assembly RNA-binding protein YhbY [Fusobacterium]NME35977.1 ribosome assembly RNA-binding protein YhbY [Fusobacterium sp. FSA-380-WT-3A]